MVRTFTVCIGMPVQGIDDCLAADIRSSGSLSVLYQPLQTKSAADGMPFLPAKKPRLQSANANRPQKQAFTPDVV